MATQGQLYTFGDVCRNIGIRRHRLAYLLECGRVRESLRLGGRRIFTDADLATIAQQLGVTYSPEKAHQKEEHELPTTNPKGSRRCHQVDSNE